MKTPPQIKSSPISGHYKMFKNDPIGLLLESSEKLGDIFMLKAFNKPIYFVNSPELISYVTQENYTNFIKTPATPLRLILGDSIFTTDGEEWLKRRRLYQPALNNTAIRSYVSAVHESTSEALIEIQKSKENPVNFTRLMTNLTINVLGRSLFSTNLELGNQLHEDIEVIMQWIGDRRLRHPFVVPTNWPTSKNKKFMSAVKSMDALIYKIVDQKKKEGAISKDLLSRFMQHKEDGQPSLNAKELRDEVMTIFLAGHETSANVLNWTFHMLATHQDVQQKAFEEIIKLNKEVLNYEDLHALPYIVQVLNETMRLYPPVWHFGRVNVEDDQIGGYHIPAGTSVRISPLTIQRNNRYWKDPEVFDPEKFSQDKTIEAYTHIPFGAGPRLCAGRNFAMMEMVLTIAGILRKYKLTSTAPKVEIAPMITLRSKGDIHLKCENRN